MRIDRFPKILTNAGIVTGRTCMRVIVPDELQATRIASAVDPSSTLAPFASTGPRE